MSHILHKTPAVILGSMDRGESNKVIVLLTRDLGVVYAHAQNLRSEQSKLRMSIRTLATIEAGLVRGKGMWRLVQSFRLHDGLAENQTETFRACMRVASVIRKMVQTEEPVGRLFEILHSAIIFAAEHTSEEMDSGIFEALTLARVLHFLGYVDDQTHALATFSADRMGGDLSHPEKETLVAMVNTSLRQL